MATNYDITATKGSNLNLRFIASDSAGNPVDLSLYTASGYVRSGYGVSDILLNLSPTIHESYISGYVDVLVLATGLADLPITQAIYDIKVYNSTTNCSTEIARGYFNINPAATI